MSAAVCAVFMAQPKDFAFTFDSSVLVWTLKFNRQQTVVSTTNMTSEDLHVSEPLGQTFKQLHV